MPARIMLSLILAGGVSLSGTDAFPQARPLFTQQERQSRADARPNPLCKPEPYETAISYSELTVFDSREIVYQTSTVARCLGQVGDPPLAHRWEAPGGTAAVFRSTLSAPEFEQFRLFLDRADVRALQSFMNAGPGVGDFRVAITRSGGTQNIEVLSLSPNHVQLVADPSLIHLICKAKEMARMASRSGELPEWCRNARPLTPPAHARGAGHVRLKAEQVTTLHVGQTAAVQFGSKALHSIGSGGGSLVLIQQRTNKDGGKVYVYRAAYAGGDTLVATPVGRQPGQCISCVTRHYFIKVVP
jgi:hypothetical protein